MARLRLRALLTAYSIASTARRRMASRERHTPQGLAAFHKTEIANDEFVRYGPEANFTHR